jgi:hypothetical protein
MLTVTLQATALLLIISIGLLFQAVATVSGVLSQPAVAPPLGNMCPLNGNGICDFYCLNIRFWMVKNLNTAKIV